MSLEALAAVEARLSVIEARLEGIEAKINAIRVTGPTGTAALVALIEAVRSLVSHAAT